MDRVLLQNVIKFCFYVFVSCVYIDGAAPFYPIICGDVLTLNLNYEAFADRGRDSVARDTQVGSHVCPLDAVQEQRLPLV